MLIIVYVIYLILSLIKWVVWSIMSYIQWEKELGLEPAADGWTLDWCREGKESGRGSWECTTMWIYHMFSAEALFKGDVSKLLVQSSQDQKPAQGKVSAKQTKSKWPLLLRDSPDQTNALRASDCHRKSQTSKRMDWGGWNQKDQAVSSFFLSHSVKRRDWHQFF